MEAKIFSHNNIKPPVKGRCGFFVKRKQRYCKMLPSKSQRFCAEHMSEDSQNDGNKRKRVLCPMDKKHTVFEDCLEKHLKKCNATIKTQLPYYIKDKNIGIKDYAFSDQEKLSLSATPVEELKLLIEKVEQFSQKIDIQLKESYQLHPVLNEELDITTYGPTVRKHLLQQASLIHILKDTNSLCDDTAVIEFGAGKGALSHWVQKAMPTSKNVNFFLVDRQNNRNRFDCYHKGEDQGPNFQRLSIDIQHLDLGKVNELVTSQQGIVGIGKHLCGGATDLSLRCLFESSNENKELEPKEKRQKTDFVDRLHSCLFALCCYHRCTWNTYVGRDVLSKEGFNNVDFHRLTKMAGWSVCGFAKRDKKVSNSDTSEKSIDTVIEEHSCPEANKDERLGLSSIEQEAIGRKCKRIIDYGRMEYICNYGYSTELVIYIQKDITPENIALKIYKK